MNYQLTESKDVEERLLANLKAKYSQERSGIHVSDLTLCVRQAVFRQLYPVAPNSTKLGYFLDGARKHQTLQELYGDSAISEFAGTFEGVSFHIDLLDKIPIELKTTRSNKLGNRVSLHWIRQILYYMLAVNSLEGYIQIYLINQKEGNNFPAHKVEMKNYQQINYDFHNRKYDFEYALDQKRPDKANSVFNDPNENWACKGCDYLARCKEIEKK